MTDRETDALGPFAASFQESVRFEIQMRERTIVQDMNLEMLLDKLNVHRRGDRVNWTLGIVRMILSRDATRELIARSIHMLEDEDKISIAEAIQADLERLEYRPRRARGQ